VISKCSVSLWIVGMLTSIFLLQCVLHCAIGFICFWLLVVIGGLFSSYDVGGWPGSPGSVCY
jgi:hypothetical protein